MLLHTDTCKHAAHLRQTRVFQIWILICLVPSISESPESRIWSSDLEMELKSSGYSSSVPGNTHLVTYSILFSCGFTLHCISFAIQRLVQAANVRIKVLAFKAHSQVSLLFASVDLLSVFQLLFATLTKGCG